MEVLIDENLHWNPQNLEDLIEPFLLNGDLIFVGKSKLTITNEVLSEVTSPFQVYLALGVL